MADLMQQARELLAAEYESRDMKRAAHQLRYGYALTNAQELAINAIAAALRAAPEGCQRDADRYRELRRKVCIVGNDFHVINMHPTYVAPDAGIELDSVLDALIDARPQGVKDV